MEVNQIPTLAFLLSVLMTSIKVYALYRFVKLTKNIGIFVSHYKSEHNK